MSEKETSGAPADCTQPPQSPARRPEVLFHRATPWTP